MYKASQANVNNSDKKKIAYKGKRTCVPNTMIPRLAALWSYESVMSFTFKL